MINERHYPKPQTSSSRYLSFVDYLQFDKFKLPLILTIIHIPLGILFYRFNGLSMLHQLSILLIGLYWAIRSDIKLERVAYISAYLVGSEILGRMAGSMIFYEFGKYGIAAIMIIALVKRGLLKIPILPLLYFVFLIPGCLLTILEEGVYARNMLSGVMSGPLLLAVSCWFFSHLKLNLTQIKNLLISIAIPLISVAVATLFFTVTIEDIQFTTESNDATSGGFGPNQVSSMLGLGAFVCLACFLLFKNDLRNILFLCGLALLFIMQSVMTFSRGGMYNAIGAILVVLFFQMKNLSQSLKGFIPILGLGLIFLLFVFPYLNDFTGGKLQERFESSNTTNRMTIMETDFQIFYENPVLGIGVARSKFYRKKFDSAAAASHTEFTRMLADHGIFGLFSLVAMGLLIILNLKRQKTSLGKALIAGAIVWSSLFMLNVGMRLAAPAFLFGLSFLTILHFKPGRKRIPKIGNQRDGRQVMASFGSSLLESGDKARNF